MELALYKTPPVVKDHHVLSEDHETKFAALVLEGARDGLVLVPCDLRKAANDSIDSV